MIPNSTNYPEEIDSNDNLFEVHDALRVRLIEDYNPGDTSITVLGDEAIMQQFSDTGIITLTEQCSDATERAISFYYGSKTLTTFDDLEILENFTDTVKPKNITNVVQNVVAPHHNNLKDALIAIQRFAGKKGEEPIRALEGTMEQRTSYLRSIALVPKAWFSVDKTIGLAPLTVEFTDQSFRLNTDGNPDNVERIWDFGDNTGPSIITIEETEEVPEDQVDVLVEDTDGGKIRKTYTEPGIYTVSYTVRNPFGEDEVIFSDLINVRFPAPDNAIIEFVQRAGQIVTDGSPTGGPYETPPTIRAAAGSIIDVVINSGINSFTGKTYSGETVNDSNTPIDPIVSYTWSLADDLTHGNSSSTRAVYSIGGVYDLILRADTEFGSYRITTYEDCIDVVEKSNLWLWTFDATETNVVSSEFGLISETFKTKSSNNINLSIDDSFLDDAPNEEQQKRELKRNNGFAQRGSTSSGNGGVGILYWASGRNDVQTATDEKIYMREYNGFFDTYVTKPDIDRPWNWIGLSSFEKTYFFFGGVTTAISPETSPTNQTKHTVLLSDMTVSSSTIASTNYKNGADELKNNEVTYDVDGDAEQGNMSVYRSTWHNSTGYWLRNQGVGAFFRIKSFYKTSGNIAEPFQDIRKLPDMTGPARVEGQLVSLSQGPYFFSNSGAVAAYNEISGVWGSDTANSTAFRLLQDSSYSDFDDSAQTLLATSDGDKVAYLSFDYSPNTFIKFNETDTTFSSITPRPAGSQWLMCVF